MKKEIKMYKYDDEGKIVKFKQLKRKKNSRRLCIDLKENIKVKLEEISKKENKSQTEIVSELIRDYEMYRRTILSISDDVKLMIKCFEILNEDFTSELRRHAKDEIIKDEKKIRKMQYQAPQQGIFLRIKYKNVLDEIALKEDRYKSEIIDELLKNYYIVNYDNRNRIYKIKNELNIFKMMLERMIGYETYKKMEKKYFADKFGRMKRRKEQDDK